MNFMGNNKILEIIKAGGGIIAGGGLAVLLAYMLWSTVTNHISHNTEVLTRVEKSIDANTAQSVRLEQVIINLERKIK